MICTVVPEIVQLSADPTVNVTGKAEDADAETVKASAGVNVRLAMDAKEIV